MRKYLDLWEQVKSARYLQISAPRKNHRTIALGIRKESIRDKAFRFLCVNSGKSYRIYTYSTGDILHVRIEWNDKIPASFTR